MVPSQLYFGMNYWLVKQEPESYPFSRLVADKKTSWTGVRNFQARNNLRAMKKGDFLIYYHSVTEKAAVGIAKVVKEAHPDPTAEEGDWVCVEIAADKPLIRPVTLEEIKKVPALQDMVLVKNSRLSVQPLTDSEFKTILKMASS